MKTAGAGWGWLQAAYNALDSEQAARGVEPPAPYPPHELADDKESWSMATTEGLPAPGEVSTTTTTAVPGPTGGPTMHATTYHVSSTGHDGTMRPIVAETAREAAEIAAGRVARRLYGRRGRVGALRLEA